MNEPEERKTTHSFVPQDDGLFIQLGTLEIRTKKGRKPSPDAQHVPIFGAAVEVRINGEEIPWGYLHSLTVKLEQDEFAVVQFTLCPEHAPEETL